MGKWKEVEFPIAVCLDSFESGQRALHFAECFIQYIQISTEYLNVWSTFKHMIADWVFLKKQGKIKGPPFSVED